MADDEAQLSAELKALVNQHEAYKVRVAEEHELVEKLLQRLQEKEQTLENLQSGLDDQTESRRAGRSVQSISSLTSVQHLLVLIDGNQHFFKHDLVRAGTPGAREAIENLLADVKDYAKNQHKNDLPETISVVVHIFSDVGRLAQDLSATNLLPDPEQLWTFIQDVSRLAPCVTVSDCGAGHESVEAKMKQFYELYIENCHCRHIFLALGHESEYYNVLQLYTDDEYTKAKTSLVQPEQGFPPGVNIPFHTVSLSTLGSVPRNEDFSRQKVPTVNGEVSERPWADGPERPAAVSTAPEAKSVPNTTPITAFHNPKVVSSASNIESPRPNELPLPPSPAPPVDTAPAQEQLNGTVNNVQNSSSAGVVKLESSAHSSSNSNKSAEQGWETTPTAQQYLPPAIEGAWGDEGADAVAGDRDRSNPTGTWTSHPLRPYHGNNDTNRTQQPVWRQERASTRTAYSAPRRGRRVPQQFEGSWDDMVEQERRQSQPSTHDSSPTLAWVSASTHGTAAKLKANGFLSSSFDRQEVTMAEPRPNKRPIRALIALNQYDQRIDLKLPRPSPADTKAFEVRSRNRRLCNEHHLRLNCNNPLCPYNHEPISDGVYLALRHTARTLPCSIGPNCRRHDCFGGHHCANVSNSTSCGRPRCPFKARMHEPADLVIVRTIEPLPKQGS